MTQASPYARERAVFSTPAVDPEPEPAREILDRYRAVLRRRRRLVIGLPLGAALLAGLLTFFTPRYYEASGAFMPQEGNTAMSGLGALASQFGLAAARASASSPQFYADLVKSREVMRAVLVTTYNVKRPKPFSGTLIQFFDIKEDDPDRRTMLALEALRSRMSVDFDRLTGLVRLRVKMKSPDLSTQVVNRFLEVVAAFNLQRRQEQGKAERQFMEERLADVRGELTRAEEDLAAFHRRNRRVNDSPELLAEQARLEREMGIRQQVYLSLMQNYQTARLDEVRNTPVIAVLERPEGFVERKGRGTLRSVLFGLILGGVVAVFIVAISEFLRNAPRTGIDGQAAIMEPAAIREAD